MANNDISLVHIRSLHRVPSRLIGLHYIISADNDDEDEGEDVFLFRYFGPKIADLMERNTDFLSKLNKPANL